MAFADGHEETHHITSFIPETLEGNAAEGRDRLGRKPTRQKPARQQGLIVLSAEEKPLLTRGLLPQSSPC